MLCGDDAPKSYTDVARKYTEMQASEEMRALSEKYQYFLGGHASLLSAPVPLPHDNWMCRNFFYNNIQEVRGIGNFVDPYSRVSLLEFAASPEGFDLFVEALTYLKRDFLEALDGTRSSVLHYLAKSKVQEFELLKDKTLLIGSTLLVPSEIHEFSPSSLTGTVADYDKSTDSYQIIFVSNRNSQTLTLDFEEALRLKKSVDESKKHTKCLIEHGFDNIKFLGNINRINESGETPLLNAIRSGNKLGLAKMLVKMGANVSADFDDLKQVMARKKDLEFYAAEETELLDIMFHSDVYPNYRPTIFSVNPSNFFWAIHHGFWKFALRFFKESYCQIQTSGEQEKFQATFDLPKLIEYELTRYLLSRSKQRKNPHFLKLFLVVLKNMYEYDDSTPETALTAENPSLRTKQTPLIFTFRSVFASVNTLIIPNNSWSLESELLLMYCSDIADIIQFLVSIKITTRWYRRGSEIRKREAVLNLESMPRWQHFPGFSTVVSLSNRDKTKCAYIHHPLRMLWFALEKHFDKNFEDNLWDFADIEQHVADSGLIQNRNLNSTDLFVSGYLNFSAIMILLYFPVLIQEIVRNNSPGHTFKILRNVCNVCAEEDTNNGINPNLLRKWIVCSEETQFLYMRRFPNEESNKFTKLHYQTLSNIVAILYHEIFKSQHVSDDDSSSLLKYKSDTQLFLVHMQSQFDLALFHYDGAIEDMVLFIGTDVFEQAILALEAFNNQDLENSQKQIRIAINLIFEQLQEAKNILLSNFDEEEKDLLWNFFPNPSFFSYLIAYKLKREPESSETLLSDNYTKFPLGAKSELHGVILGVLYYQQWTSYQTQDRPHIVERDSDCMHNFERIIDIWIQIRENFFQNCVELRHNVQEHITKIVYVLVYLAMLGDDGKKKQIEDHINKGDDYDQSVGVAVRIDKFSDSSIDMYVRCFTKTNSWTNYLQVKENLALEIKKIVEGKGAAFAFPSQSIYVEKK